MIYAVFLCDKQWKIITIKQCSLILDFKPGDFLTDMVLEKEKLEHCEEKRCSVELTFLKTEIKVPAIIDYYKEGNLVVLASIKSNQEFLEIGNMYPEYQEWAKDHMLGLFHNEYYLIQQINNQLVDAKRQLMRSNRKLEQALKENEEINRKLDNARILAERASTSKTNFLASMSHDIRTPMNAIIGLTELMQHHLSDPEILEGYINKLRFSSKYLLDLINDILDLSKIESGSLELKIEPIDLGAQIAQILTIARPQMMKKHLHLSMDHDEIKERYLMGDPVRIRQVLMNVFSNAIKYTPEGGKIHFEIREKKSGENQSIVQFVIEDSGIGMSQEFLKHIFDPFARAKTSEREIQGTGLGMAITKSIVDVFHGTIHVTSTPGIGSRFEIVIPFEICEDPSAAKPVAAQPDEKHENTLNLTGMHFLCAEDNKLNAEILRSMLEMEGAECTIYENGKLLTKAFETLLPGQYQAILMDVQMPLMNGYEATRKIRTGKNPLGKTIPIIAMTADAFSEDIRRCLDAGMNAHISKPLDFNKLKEILGMVLH